MFACITFIFRLYENEIKMKKQQQKSTLLQNQAKFSAAALYTLGPLEILRKHKSL